MVCRVVVVLEWVSPMGDSWTPARFVERIRDWEKQIRIFSGK